ncbi:phosphomannomutase/phosphoglucomutase [Verticiella sediminum]|uniref:Phosphomannomutase/phosphoglucomutase n=1 Tax=Verticiella sediminum TaxID=1247510 RepID=A0A556AY75_9BURK|nr:phosphomannomutase/phosphoglucomutase [Verticiella sediminum]TSH97903.1 phosphomannomutase/phosphoglucomutase [Verticiella sediminum]
MQPIGTHHGTRHGGWTRGARHWPSHIDPGYARLLGAVLAGWMRERGADALLLGHEGRAADVELAAALQAGARSSGVRVFDAGPSTAPLLRFGARLLGTRTLIHIGSAWHAEHATLFEIEHDGVAGDEDFIAELQMRMLLPTPRAGLPGGYTLARLAPAYTSRLACDIRLPRPRRIALDAGAGATGRLVEGALRALGCEVVQLFFEGEAAGAEPAWQPADPGSLQALRYCLKYSGADVGIAMDAAGTRTVLVRPDGQCIGADAQLILFARDLLTRQPGARVVIDMQSSRSVASAVRAAGGLPILAHAEQIRARMRETGALLGGDALGRLHLQDRWHAGADAVYAAARLIELAESLGDTATRLPAPTHATPPCLVDTGNVEPERLLASLAEEKAFAGAYRSADRDGVRVDYSDGFGAASAATGVRGMVVRFEADSAQALARIQAAFRRQLRRVAPRLPFTF